MSGHRNNLSAYTFWRHGTFRDHAYNLLNVQHLRIPDLHGVKVNLRFCSTDAVLPHVGPTLGTQPSAPSISPILPSQAVQHEIRHEHCNAFRESCFTAARRYAPNFVWRFWGREGVLQVAPIVRRRKQRRLDGVREAAL